MSRTNKRSTARFRIKLLGGMMLVVAVLTALELYLAQRKVAANAARDLQQSFQAELSSLHKLQELRHAALAERCRALAAKPRIHAALEDNALDLLYPSAKDDLRDLMEIAEPPAEGALYHARFYRFLDRAGAVLPPPNPRDVGGLSTGVEAQLAFKKLPELPQIGYLSENAGAAKEAVDEIMVVPIISSDTGEVISALVVGSKAFEVGDRRPGAPMQSGIWLNGRLHLPYLPKSTQAALGAKITAALAKSNRKQNSFIVRVNGAPQFLFYKLLNPGSIFPPAYEICLYSLADSIAQQHRLRWQIGGAGTLLLLGGFLASYFVAGRLSVPVEKLASDSEQDRAQRERAEAALESRSKELERTARYSADASHQLKSPVTVLRTGLETLLGREDFHPQVYEELSALLHQTRRLTGVIDDLLLLSRMDAGRLQIKSDSVNLSQLVEEWLDDLAALPDSPEVKIEKEIPAEIGIVGERRYTSLVVQNLLENARKYNRAGGRIRVRARRKNGEVVLAIGNTGRPISRIAQEHVFERFHHTSNASGHGLGLNLACELASLHGGDLRLVSSNDDWTEFELRLRGAPLRENHEDPPG